MDEKRMLRALRNVLIELVVYGVLVTMYALTVLRLLIDPLTDLYESNLTLYGWVALALVVIQGLVLESVTSFLLNRLRLSHFE